jgi:hypothetical protein
MGYSRSDYAPEYSNPMGDQEDSPLAKYAHLLPSASIFVNPLDQYQFLGRFIPNTASPPQRVLIF